MPFAPFRHLLAALSRKKSYDEDVPDNKGQEAEGVKLARCLGLIDLTLLGVGSTLGVGVYVLAGSVAKNQAGPSVLVSLVVAAVASMFSGFCYVEFASRISKSGSAYTYTYLSIGEFAAYTIGWNLVLEYIIGTASEAKAISNQFDSLVGNYYAEKMTALLPIDCAFMADYPDFIAAGITVTMTGVISYGVAESTRLNSIFTFLNLATVAAIVLSGLGRINFANWAIRRADIPPEYQAKAGNGGFAPFGINGIIVGAAKCFFGFVGFDCIATTGEEAKNPKRNIPLSILLSLFIVFCCFFAIALVLTLIIPYYEQDADAPFPHIFNILGLPFMKWVVTIGSLFALLTGMFGALFPLPRILYAMSQDGLLYPSFAYVSPRTKTPVVSSLLSGLLTAVLSAIFKLDQLVDMLSIGTLLAYTIVAISVLILRYSEEEDMGNSKTESIEYIADRTQNEHKANNISEYNSKNIHDGPHAEHSIGIDTCEEESSESKMNGYTRNNHIDDGYLGSVVCNGTSDAPNTVNQVSQRSQTLPADRTDFCETGLSIEQLDKNIWSDAKSKDELVDHNHTQESKEQPRDKLADRTYSVQFSSIHKENGNICDDSLEQPSMKFGSLNKNYSREHLCEVSHPGERSRVARLLNLNSPSSLVTRASQRLSKICISLFMILTIVGCLILNSVSNVNFDLESSTEANMTLARPSGNYWQMRAHSSGERQSYSSKRGDEDRSSETLADFITRQLLRMTVKATKLGSESRRGISSTPTVESTDAAFQMADEIGAPSSSTAFVKAAIYVSIAVTYGVVFLVLSRQNQTRPDCNFKVPLVPFIPCMSIFMNIYLMINLDVSTWVRFVVWMVVGMSVYFTYGIRNSKLKTA